MAFRILLLVGLCAATGNADIYRWDTGEMIPGTEGIEPGPGVQLDNVNLEYADLSGRNLTGARFESARLSHASFYRSNLTDADLTGAVVTGVEFSNSTLAKEQLYSTASYKERNLSGIAFGRRQQTIVNNRTHLDASGWDFREQNLTGARFSHVKLTDAKFDGALVTAVDFGRDQNLFGLTEDQLASTSSYLAKDLRGIVLGGNISGWNLGGQNLTNSVLGGEMANANLSYATLINAVLSSSSSNINLTGANLKGAALLGFSDSAIFDSTTVYNQWTTFPFGFDPTANKLSLSPSPRGDFTVDDLLDRNDVDMVADFLQFAEDLESQPLWFYALTDHRFDLNNDALIDQEDIRVWAHDIKHTWLGDADLDGEFNSSDLVQALTTGKYESAAKDHVFGRLIDPAGWSEGDWNADNEFTSADLVVALSDGGYEQGLRPAANPVPEPTSIMLLMTGLAGTALVSRTRRKSV